MIGNGEKKMLSLNKKSLKNSSEWERAGIALPQFDIDKMTAATESSPEWVHFGSGNIFRSFIAALQQELLSKGKTQAGIVAVETYDEEIIDKIYRPYDNLSLLVLMKADGTLEKKVIAGVGQSLVGDPSRSGDWDQLKSIFSKKSLKMASFTVTEKGYVLRAMSGEYIPEVQTDIEKGPIAPRHLISKISALAYERFKNGAYPIAFVSMDNCSHNGEKLQSAMLDIIGCWVERGLAEKAFFDYMNDSKKVSFPWTMIDKITPRPSETVREVLDKLGVADMGIICTNKKTYIASFVNAEVPQYLVVEDSFPNGRMPLEAAGVLFADRETVEKVERMKVTTCLNPLHTALAIFGCLLGYSSIAAEMRNSSLKKLVEKIGYEEGMPVVVNPGILSPEAFLKEVIEKRLPNPYIPDTPQRIVCDTSLKVGIRFGETIKSYITRADLDVKALKYIPLAIAGWCRYLMGIDDNGETMELGFDPMLDELKSNFSDVRLGDINSVGCSLKPILSNEKIFGVDLYKVGMDGIIDDYFRQMISGRHAVREVLNKYLG
jgi:fructuronate reductase